MNSEKPDVADVCPAWLLWRPREPHLALAWALMLLIAPFVLVARLLRRQAWVRNP